MDSNEVKQTNFKKGNKTMNEKLKKISEDVSKYVMTLTDKEFDLLCSELKAKREENFEETYKIAADGIVFNLRNYFNKTNGGRFVIEFLNPDGQTAFLLPISEAEYNSGRKTLCLKNSIYYK